MTQADLFLQTSFDNPSQLWSILYMQISMPTFFSTTSPLGGFVSSKTTEAIIQSFWRTAISQHPIKTSDLKESWTDWQPMVGYGVRLQEDMLSMWNRLCSTGLRSLESHQVTKADFHWSANVLKRWATSTFKKGPLSLFSLAVSVTG